MMRTDKSKTPEDRLIRLPLGITNDYLIPLKEGYLLFDTGYKWVYKKFLQQLEKHSVSAQEIRYVLLSHHHDDHVGFLNQLVQDFPTIQVIMHEKTVSLIAEGKNNTKEGGCLVNRRIAFLLDLKSKISPQWDLSFPPYAKRACDIVLEGEQMLLPFQACAPLMVFLTPGHSSDSITLAYGQKILCGDLASNFLNWAGTHHLPVFNENIEQVYASWEQLLKRSPTMIFPAHGKPFLPKKLARNLGKSGGHAVPYC